MWIKHRSTFRHDAVLRRRGPTARAGARDENVDHTLIGRVPPGPDHCREHVRQGCDPAPARDA